MARGQSENARYCADLVRAHDEDRWLAAQYASADAKRKLLALYAFHCEVRRVPSLVSEPPLGEIRLQWRREALAELREGKRARGHPVIEEIAVAGLHNPSFADDMASLLDAAARALYAEPFRDVDELASWLRLSEGAVDATAAKMLGASSDLARAAASAGVAFALARDGARRAPELKAQIEERAREEWGRRASTLNAAPAAIAPAFLHLALTRAYLKRADRPFPLWKRARLFAAAATGRY